jgi:peroxiredoxin
VKARKRRRGTLQYRGNHPATAKGGTMKRNTFILLALGMATLLFAARADEYEDTTVTKTGEKAPDFSCETIDGEKFALKDYAGKVVFINFFATWCGPCLSELPHLEKEVHDAFKGNEDFKLIVIGREHTAEELKAFRMEKSLDLPFAPDPDRAIYSLYATKFIPRNIIIGRDGVVKYAEAGFSEDKLKEQVTIIQAELALKVVDPAPVPLETLEKETP